MSGLAMWWLRRPESRLAAPARTGAAALPRPVLFGTLALAALLPLLAVSLVGVFALDRCFVRRLARSETALN